ncbi:MULTISPECIES: alpha/beta fold hydrolase [unclassified Beijerinckia]|uniref:alpha/beta fold hydrolase n=1 Tax=unclassified Beijerinckia TaxID=2638183 RepID=UPI000895C377|nr:MULTISPECIES: alpha/beta fold hydrolase [unclassified Beijerinckia]MDH7798737.1 pimeloyl-ACP methyl ester carboxylesterase [Beijerinckia sp. GAS462]SED31368.1 Alpha/beta hydrolase family protein [Beijerinckia sp. 28-YEA-48]
MTKIEWDRVPVVISFAETVRMVETYGFVGSQGITVLEGQRLVPRNRPSDTVFLFMHPATTLNLLPMPTALADSGLHVMCCGSRYAKNDSALIIEKVVYDLGQYVRHAREVLGYRKVVLVGWSGGGSLSLFYQAQAEAPTITHTPAGDPYDLTTANLQPADGVIFIAAHLSRAETLTEWLDPSLRNEADPDDRDLELDIYNAQCPAQPPYSADFVARFRSAQLARNRRITANVQAMLEKLKKKNDGEMERGFVVHRTNCDVRWLDPAVDPNGRKPGWCFLGDPRIANSAPAGIARYTSLRSWLSQWSVDHTNARGVVNAARITKTPVLQIVNQADDAVPATHNPAIRAALATTDKDYVEIQGATHYFLGQPAELAQCIGAVSDWSRRKALLEN